jgi:hypothetical protein
LDREDAARKRQAWYNWLASTNRPIFGQEKFELKPFEVLFAEPPPPKPKVTAEEVARHGLKLLE